MTNTDRLFSMRQRAEKTTDLIKQIQSTFLITQGESAILAIMASNFDSYHEGRQHQLEDDTVKLESLLKDFSARFYASDYLEDRDSDVKIFLRDRGYEV